MLRRELLLKVFNAYEVYDREKFVMYTDNLIRLTEHHTTKKMVRDYRDELLTSSKFSC